MLTPLLTRRLFVCLFVFGCLPCALHAQEWAEKMFSAKKHDFGAVAKGSKVQHRLVITNLYKEDIVISNVRTTCGCTAAKPSMKVLKSRQKAFIQIEMDTFKFSHHKDSNVIVTFAPPFAAEVRIPIHAYIRTDIEMVPGSVQFPSAQDGKGATQVMNITYAGRTDWKIKGVKTTSKYVTASVKETGRQFGRVRYQMTVNLGKDAPIGSLRDQIVLLTDDPNTPRVPILVEGNVKKVQGDITVTQNISFGRVATGTKVTKNIFFRGNNPFQIKSIECKSDKECFRMSLPDQPRKHFVLPLTLFAPKEEGSFTEEFTVMIAGRKQPLTFRAEYRVIK